MHSIFPAVNLLTYNFQHVLGNFSACCCSREASQGHFLFKIHTKSSALNDNNWRWLPLCAVYKRPRCLSHSELLFYYFALFCFTLLFYFFFFQVAWIVFVWLNFQWQLLPIKLNWEVTMLLLNPMLTSSCPISPAPSSSPCDIYSLIKD